MLCEFAVTNYRGFEHRIEWDLTKIQDYKFNNFAIKNNVIKNGIIYGSNGSGKSNFGLAIFDIVNHLTHKLKKPDYYANFVFAGNQGQTVDFEYTFKFGNQIIEYDYSKNAQGILVSEKLSHNLKLVFERKHGSFEIDSKEFSMTEKAKDNFAVSTNNVSVINSLLISFPLPDNHYLIKMQDFVNSMLWCRSVDEKEFIGFGTQNTSPSEFIIRNNLINDFSKFLEDVSNQYFDFVLPSPADKELFCYIKGNPVPFSPIVSTGTRSLLLLYYWYKQLDKASFVFIDEFDAFYHFSLSKDICRKLFSLDCQVFLTSHNTLLLCNDLLRPDCSFLLDKGEIKALHDCTDKELREGYNKIHAIH